MKNLLLIAVLFLSLVTGCSRPSDANAAPTPAPAPAPAVSPTPVAPVAPPPAVRSGDLQGYAPEAVVSVAFKEINDGGYPIVVLENLTGRDIETIRGAFIVEDVDGATLHRTGLTIAVPGQRFIAADSTVDASPFGLNRKVEVMERLASAPETFVFRFEATDVTFLEGDAADSAD